jgi:hypothetical protein
VQRFAFNSEELFRSNLIKGQIAKELVKGLLEHSGYHVYAFGYESSISQLRYDVLNKGRVPNTESNKRIRSMPDLIVHDKEEHKTSFVEVKFSTTHSPEHVRLSTKGLSWTKTYWNDCILVVVIPAAHNFYARKINEVNIFGEYKFNRYNLSKEFYKIEEEFQRILPESIHKYKTIREQFLEVGSLEAEEVLE